MKRKTLSAVLAGLLVLSLAGCGGNTYENTSRALEDSSAEDVNGDGIYISGEERRHRKEDDSASETDTDESVIHADTDSAAGASGSSVYAADVKIVQSKEFQAYTFSRKENPDFEKYLKQEFADSVTSDTITYHFTVKDGRKYDVDAPEATLGDPSMDQDVIERQMKDEADSYRDLTAFEDAELTEEERWTYLCLKADMEVSLHVFDNIMLYEPFSPMRGIQANLPTNFTDYRFDTKQDLEDYISLLNQVPAYFQTCLDFEQKKADAGYFMPDDVADDVIQQCRTFAENPEDHFMIETFDSRVEKLDFLSASEKQDLKRRDRKAVQEALIPAFTSVADTLTKLKGTGKVSGGICNYEGGKKYYEDYLLKTYVGSEKSADEMIDMLDDRAEEAVREMSEIYSTDPEAYQYYSDHYDTLFQKADSSSPTDVIREIERGKSMRNFPSMKNIPYTLNYLDKSMESVMENTLAYYMSPAIDDEEDNIIYVNGAYTTGMWTTLAHEGVPGHMLQNAYFQSTNPNPVRAVAGNLGYQEGWAVYASYLTLPDYDYGAGSSLENADVARLYELNEALGYLVYGRIDLGVNDEGWDEQDASDYMKDIGFGTDGVADIYKTVVGDPGVYLSYSAGYYEMLELQEKAGVKEGDYKAEREFTTEVLNAGPCMFGLLEDRVE